MRGRLLFFVGMVVFANWTHAEQLATARPSFVVYTYRGGPTADEMIQRCEALREEIQQTWLGTFEREPWQPRCEIVLHATRASYCRAVGRAVASYGSSLIRSDGKKIVKRRIDLLVKSNREFPALTHELTHVVLADRFGTDQPPMWADEGIATLADTEAKKKLHCKDCMIALRSGSSIRIANLLHLQQFTSSHQVPAFYGQSLMLVQFFVDRSDQSKLIPFVELAKQQGYDRALRDIYGIDGVDQLENLWREYALDGNQNQTVAAGG